MRNKTFVHLIKFLMCFNQFFNYKLWCSVLSSHHIIHVWRSCFLYFIMLNSKVTACWSGKVQVIIRPKVSDSRNVLLCGYKNLHFVGRLATRFWSVPKGICAPSAPRARGRGQGSVPDAGFSIPYLVNYVFMGLALYTGTLSCWDRFEPRSSSEVKL